MLLNIKYDRGKILQPTVVGAIANRRQIVKCHKRHKNHGTSVKRRGSSPF